MVNIITRNSDGTVSYMPYNTTNMCRVILEEIPYDLDNRASAVDFIAFGEPAYKRWGR